MAFQFERVDSNGKIELTDTGKALVDFLEKHFYVRRKHFNEFDADETISVPNTESVPNIDSR